MRPGEPSRTAFGAAAHRAAHQDLEGGRIFSDPLAWRILGADRDSVLERAREEDRARLRLFIAVRHRFAEDGLAVAVERGTGQVVVLGAGLDTFAYRNPYADVRVFEVDMPATGEWKAERLREAGIPVPQGTAFVGCDFEREDFLERLAAGGFDVTRPAYFLWLGVVPYLSREAVAATLARIGTLPGAEVVLDYPGPATGLSGPEKERRAAFERRLADLGEPLTAAYRPEEMGDLLHRSGFSDVEDLGRSEIRQRYLGLPGIDASSGPRVVRARAGVTQPPVP